MIYESVNLKGVLYEPKQNKAGCIKNLRQSGEKYIVASPFSFVFAGCLIGHVINAARIVLFQF